MSAASVRRAEPGSVEPGGRPGGAATVVCAGVGLWLVQRVAVVVTWLIRGGSLPGDLMKWDAQWYARIAVGGYHWPLPQPGHSDPWLSDLAFFPGFPALTRAVSLTGLDAAWAALVTAWIGFACAAGVIVLVGREVGGAPTGVLLVLLWGAAPRSLVQNLGYSEGWFIALVGLGLLMGLRRQWIRAGLAICVAGVFRPAVVPMGVLLALAWVAAWPVFRRGVDSGERRRRFLGAALTPWGFLAYAAVVAARTGRWDGYLLVQRAWGSSLGWSTEVFHKAAQYWPIAPFNWTYFGLVAASMILYAVLLVAMIASRESPLLWGQVALVLLLTVFSVGYFQSRARFLLPAFPAFLPVARLLEKAPRWLCAATMVVITGLSTWWSVYVLGGPYSP
ncbi:hypothetical protein [Acidipropionibacterium acidipropionici]|uniref:hypothetical protein n=1 Tax=Acidipropionibacterium acidipropionici TaxID=1748 RepID=UPI00110C1398|nr:hypothetical protein [Acidipropionibacterium acidipropionici]QCV96093.1 hypothetical protein FEZ30_13230 [Acidipropionibacterium acidipropionici]